MSIRQQLELAPAHHSYYQTTKEEGHMKHQFLKSAATRLVWLTLIFLLSIPVYVSAQGRGHGQGLNKKSTKFVNGHDASNGRFDGRGPRTSFVPTRRSGLSKKSTKFVNGHDARNGRWDGHGPKSVRTKPKKIR
jgi:hypothetical protein